MSRWDTFIFCACVVAVLGSMALIAFMEGRFKKW